MNQRMQVCILVVVMSALAGCASDKATQRGMKVRTLIGSVRQMEAYQHPDETYTAFMQRIAIAVRDVLNAPQTANDLREIFYLCTEVADEESMVRGGADPRMAGVFLEARTAILVRLAQSHDDRSARVLVALLADPGSQIDGELAVTLRQAVIECGLPCLPYLTRLAEDAERRGAQAAEMINVIEGQPRPPVTPPVANPPAETENKQTDNQQ